MSFVPRIHEIYKHFKGDLYQITAIAEHTETGEQLVVYQAMYGEFKTYARPLSMFISKVDKEKYPDVKQEFRFELQGPDAARQKAESEEIVQQKAESEERLQQKAENEEIVQLKSEKMPQNEESVAVDEKAESRNVQAFAEDLHPAGEAAAEESGEPGLDPLLLEFLDADNYAERLNILAALHHRITDEMITTMAIASDVEIEEGDLEGRFEALKNCLVTLERYECNRLR